jgi:hypothetical protein
MSDSNLPYVYENGKAVSLPCNKTTSIRLGSDTPVILDKEFGPTIFASLRITADIKRGWVIERQWIDNGQFIEWCVIPAQIELEFEDHE